MTTPRAQENRRKARRWGLALLAWTGAVWWAGGDDGSAGVTSRFLRPLLAWLLPDAPEEALARIHFLVRKGAHVGAYGVMALLALRALALRAGGAVPRLAPPALGWVGAVAVADELRQSFLPSRTGSAGDIALDLAGGALALALAIAYTRGMQSRRAPLERG